MDDVDPPDAPIVLVVAAAAVALVALVLAFQRPVCAQGGNAACSPNGVYLLIATLAAAVAGLAFGYDRGLGAGTESE